MSGRLTSSGFTACYIALSRWRGTNTNGVRSADTRVGAVRPPIGVRRCATARGAGTPGVSPLVPYAITRPAHRDTVSVEDDSPARRRADHLTAAVRDASCVGCPANDSSIAGTRAGLVLGYRISAARLKQQAQANKNWHKWLQRDLPFVLRFWSTREYRCRHGKRSSLGGQPDPWRNVTRAPPSERTGFSEKD